MTTAIKSAYEANEATMSVCRNISRQQRHEVSFDDLMC